MLLLPLPINLGLPTRRLLPLPLILRLEIMRRVDRFLKGTITVSLDFAQAILSVSRHDSSSHSTLLTSIAF